MAAKATILLNKAKNQYSERVARPRKVSMFANANDTACPKRILGVRVLLRQGMLVLPRRDALGNLEESASPV
jgi:putative transposon-encoded protein